MADKPVPTEPYVGPAPFERTAEDSARFFGREEETGEIVSLVMAYSTVLIYAQSGAGKTSLFNASIAPELEKAGFEVLPLTRVKQIVPAIVDAADVANLYMLCALLAWVDNAEPGASVDTSLPDYLAQRPRLTTSTGRPKRRVIIFDQLEELFGFYPPDWRKQQGDFFQQIADAQAADPSLRVVFIIREDYLAQLDPFAPLLPEQLSVRFRLEPLRKEQALLAVEKPLEGTACSYASGVAEELVHELLLTRVLGPDGNPMEVEGEYVEPVQLQVVCQSLWRSLPPGTKEITGEQLQQFGDVDRALGRFYENSLQEAMAASGVSEARLRSWFTTELITPAATRGIVFSGSDDTAGIPNAGVVALDKEHIIRREERAGAGWYELTHDRFIEPIQKSNAEWHAAMVKAEAERHAAQSRATRRWIAIGAAVLGGIALVASLISLTSRQEVSVFAATATAEAARAAELAAMATADAGRAAAATAEVIATSATREAAAATATAALALSDRLAGQVEGQIETAPDAALVLAVEALRAWNTPNARWTLLAALVGQQDPVTWDALPGWGAASVKDVSFSPDGTRIATANNDGMVRLWDTTSAQQTLTLSGHSDTVRSVAYNPDGTRIVTSSDDGAAKVWDAASATEVLTLAGHDGTVWSAAYSPDGTRIVTAGNDGTTRIWDANSGELLDTLTGQQPDGILSAAYNPTGTHIVTAVADGTARVWNVASRAEEVLLSGHNGPVTSAAYSPDGMAIVTASDDGTTKVWDALSGLELLTLAAHRDGVRSAAFTPEGGRIITTGFDDALTYEGTTKVWDASTGREFVGLRLRHNGPVNGAGVSPDNRLLASVSDDGSLRVRSITDGSAAPGWELFPEAAALACRTANRDLSPAEWNEFVGAGVPYQKTCSELDLSELMRPTESSGAPPPPPPPGGAGGNY